MKTEWRTQCFDCDGEQHTLYLHSLWQSDSLSNSLQHKAEELQILSRTITVIYVYDMTVLRWSRSVAPVRLYKAPCLFTCWSRTARISRAARAGSAGRTARAAPAENLPDQNPPSSSPQQQQQRHTTVCAVSASAAQIRGKIRVSSVCAAPILNDLQTSDDV